MMLPAYVLMAKVLVFVFWLVTGIPLLMLAGCMFDEPGSRGKILSHIPLYSVLVLFFCSAVFVVFG